MSDITWNNRMPPGQANQFNIITRMNIYEQRGTSKVIKK